MRKPQRIHLPRSTALDAYIKLSRAAESVNRESMAVLLAAKLTLSQFGVMEALYHLGPLCMTELAQKILKSGGNLTLVVNNLERRGFVARKQPGKDRRFIRIELSAAGRQMIRKLLPVHLKELTARMSVLETGEQVQLARLCKKLGLSWRKACPAP